MLYPLLSQNDHQKKAAAIKSRNHGHPPEHGYNPRIPRHGNPARQPFKKPSQRFARGQDRPLWQIRLVISRPLILGRCQIIWHRKIGDQFPDKIRGHSRANQCHSKHDNKLAPAQLEWTQKHEGDHNNGKNSSDRKMVLVQPRSVENKSRIRSGNRRHHREKSTQNECAERHGGSGRFRNNSFSC